MHSLFVSFVLFVVQKGRVTVRGTEYAATLDLPRNRPSGF